MTFTSRPNRWGSIGGAELLLLAVMLAVVVPVLLHRGVQAAWTSGMLRAQGQAWAAATVGLGLMPINAHAWC